MVGPVLYLEMLLGGRRGRQLIFRYLYAGWLILQLLFLWFIYWMSVQTRRSVFNPTPPDPNATSDFATGFVEMFVVQQLILTLLITPAFTAGAITDEKTRGTLQYMLTAHLTAGEIVLGKLLGRMAQVAMLLLAGLPVLCFIGVFGGMHPPMLLAVCIVTVAPVFALGSASLLASVWARQTRDAVLGLYVVVALLFLGGLTCQQLEAGLGPTATPDLARRLLSGFNSCARFFNPIFVLEPGWQDGNLTQLARRLAGSALAWGSVGAACLGLAIWRLRSVYLSQLENTGKKKLDATARRRAPLGDEPIRWKERQVDGIAPLAVLRWVPRTLGLVLVFVLTGLASAFLLATSLLPAFTRADLLEQLSQLHLVQATYMIDEPVAAQKFLWQAIGAMLVGTLIVGIRSSGTISGEREKQTWEALLLTPLETKQLIRGKLWGIFGAAMPFLAAYALPALTCSLLGGFWPFFWTVLWLAVTLLGVYYVGAAGIFASVRSRSSWRSLLGTLGFGYVGGFVLFAITSPVIGIVALIIYAFLMLTDSVYGLGFTKVVGFDAFATAFGIATCLGLAAIFYLLAWWFIADAEKRVSDRERTRHWKDEPVYRPRPRLPVPTARYYE